MIQRAGLFLFLILFACPIFAAEYFSENSFRGMPVCGDPRGPGAPGHLYYFETRQQLAAVQQPNGCDTFFHHVGYELRKILDPNDFYLHYNASCSKTSGTVSVEIFFEPWRAESVSLLPSILVPLSQLEVDGLRFRFERVQRFEVESRVQVYSKLNDQIIFSTSGNTLHFSSGVAFCVTLTEQFRLMTNSDFAIVSNYIRQILPANSYLSFNAAMTNAKEIDLLNTLYLKVEGNPNLIRVSAMGAGRSCDATYPCYPL